jgi:hypothetical protein
MRCLHFSILLPGTEQGQGQLLPYLYYKPAIGSQRIRVENRCGEEEVHLHTSLTSALHEEDWSLLLLMKETPSALLIGAWVDLSSSLNTAAKRGLFL